MCFSVLASRDRERSVAHPGLSAGRLWKAGQQLAIGTRRLPQLPTAHFDTTSLAFNCETLAWLKGSVTILRDDNRAVTRLRNERASIVAPGRVIEKESCQHG